MLLMSVKRLGIIGLYNIYVVVSSLKTSLTMERGADSRPRVQTLLPVCKTVRANEIGCASYTNAGWSAMEC